MNHTAPAMKKGEIVAINQQYEEAVSLMIKNPILIKSPPIRVGGLSVRGFTGESLTPYLGSWDGKNDVVTCPISHTISFEGALSVAYLFFSSFAMFASFFC